MTAVLFAVVLLLAAIAIVGGTFFTIRWFIAAGRPPVEVKPQPKSRRLRSQPPAPPAEPTVQEVRIRTEQTPLVKEL